MKTKYENPLLEWAINEKGKAPSKKDAAGLVIVLNEADVGCDNLIRNAKATLERAEKLKADIAKGIRRASEVSNGKA